VINSFFIWVLQRQLRLFFSLFKTARKALSVKKTTIFFSQKTDAKIISNNNNLNFLGKVMQK